MRKIPVAIFLLVSAASLYADVPQKYQEVGKEYGIPDKILYALALVESGVKLKNKTVQPWPWTLSINAKPHYYLNKQEAVAALNQALRMRLTQLGIGLMQVERRFHLRKMKDPDRMLDPDFNLRKGAEILKDEYVNANGDWDRAIKRYHSQTEALQQKYMARVNYALNTIGRVN